MKARSIRHYPPSLEHALTTLQTTAGPIPQPLERFVERLKTDCGPEARINVISDGTTHGGTQRKYIVELISKKQKLNSLCTQQEVEVVEVNSKRSGAYVSTKIFVKVEAVSVHPVTLIN
ncbi:hypothetical protein GCM10028805_52340 [Spirosoma harenae]